MHLYTIEKRRTDNKVSCQTYKRSECSGLKRKAERKREGREFEIQQREIVSRLMQTMIIREGVGEKEANKQAKEAVLVQ